MAGRPKQTASKKSLFDHIDDITIKKSNWSEEDSKTFDTYMINRFLSMDIGLIELVDSIQMYTTGIPLDKKSTHTIYKEYLPKKKLYNKYIKQNSSVKYPDELIDLFKNYYQLGSKDVIPIIDKAISDGSSIKSILKLFGVDDKSIKNITKKINEA
jgi:predicted DNA-binding protein YlxM (UPF0122 family)